MPDQTDRSLVVWMLNHYAHPRSIPGGSRHYDLGVELVRIGNGVVAFPSSFDHFAHKHVRPVCSARRPIECVRGGMRYSIE